MSTTIAVPGPAQDASAGAPALRFATELTRAVLGARDVDALLRVVVRGGCDALGIRRCGAYLRDPAGGGYTGRAGHPTDEIDAAVRGLRLGGGGDELTRRIVAHDGPLVVRDLQRLGLGALRTWDVTAMLAVPLVHGGETLGLLAFDHAGRPHPFGPEHVRLAGAIGEVTATALARLDEEERLAARVGALGRRARVLAHTAAVDERLTRVLAEDGGVDGLLAAVVELSGRSVVVHDADGHRVAGAGPGADAIRLLQTAGDHPDLRALLADAPAGGCVQVPAMLPQGLSHRHLAAPIDLAGRRWGWVVTAERPTRLSVLDDRTLRRAAAHLALELTVQRRTAVASLDARSTLARLLIRGTHDRAEVARCAAFLGISLTAPRVVAYVTDAAGDGGTVDAETLVAGLRDEDVLVTKGPEGVALMIEVPADAPARQAVARVKVRLGAACAGLGSGGVRVGLSTVCRDPHAMPRAYREARETARCMAQVADPERAPGRHRILAADDLGPARLFVAGGDTAALSRFVDDVLGPLLDGDETVADLLRTLGTFFDHDRNVRGSAAALGIHENTVRYRLARVLQLTGHDVAADAHDQLSVQTALLVLRLQDHPALSPFGTADRPAEPPRPAAPVAAVEAQAEAPDER
jgi:sugar diacid utilization regulator